MRDPRKPSLRAVGPALLDHPTSGSPTSGGPALAEGVLQALIGFAGAEELFVRADGFDGALVENDDAVGNLERTEAVGDEERGAVVGEVFEGLGDDLLALRVRGAGGLVEDENGG